MNPDGSNATEVSDVEMNGYKYAPSRNRLLFIADVKYDKTTQDHHGDLKKSGGQDH